MAEKVVWVMQVPPTLPSVISLIGPMLTGGLAGAVASLAVNYLIGVGRRRLLYRKMTLEIQDRVGTRATARLHNGHVVPMSAVRAYITINHQNDDIIKPPNDNYNAFVTPDHPCPINEEPICWSSTAPESNPPMIDIYPLERQRLDLVNIDRAGKWIEISSEKGWTSSQESHEFRKAREEGRGKDIKTSRVFLKAKPYSGQIKIVCKETHAKVFDISIDPSNSEKPVTLKTR